MDRLKNWAQKGRLSLWRYTENTRNFPGWHLMLDTPGHTSLLDLLSRLAERDIQPGARRMVRVTTPSPAVLAVPNNRRAPAIAPSRLRLERGEQPAQWSVLDSGTEVVFTLGPDRLRGLAEWLRQPDRAFDEMFGDQPPLWFWGIWDDRTQGGTAQTGRSG